MPASKPSVFLRQRWPDAGPHSASADIHNLSPLFANRLSAFHIRTFGRPARPDIRCLICSRSNAAGAPSGFHFGWVSERNGDAENAGPRLLCCAFCKCLKPRCSIVSRLHGVISCSLSVYDLKQKSDFHALLENSLTMTLS